MSLMLDEDERLAVLEEEIGEVLQLIGKIRRFGYENRDPRAYHPDSVGYQPPTNREELALELGDVQYAILLLTAVDLNTDIVKNQTILKSRSIIKWLTHNVKAATELRDAIAGQETVDE